MRWFILIFALACASSWSAEPVKSNAQSGQRQSKPEKVGTENNPIFVKGEVTTKKDGAEASDDAQERKHKSDVDSDLVLYTGLLALFTFLLFCFTAALWWVTYGLSVEAKQASERQSKEMGKQIALVGMQVDNAIKQTAISREEFFATHRPKIIVRKFALVEDRGAPIGIQYSVVNIGASPGTVTVTSERIWLPSRTENLPALPPYSPAQGRNLTLSSGTMVPLLYRFPDEDVEEIAFTFGAQGEILFFGFVIYMDNTDRMRQTAFLRTFDHATGRFNAIEHPDYEYQD